MYSVKNFGKFNLTVVRKSILGIQDIPGYNSPMCIT